jgi:hypothetical protein
MKVLYLLLFVSIGVSATGQNNPRNLEIDWKTDLTKHEIPLDEFTALMLPDGIPPIDDPKFISIGEAKEVFFEHEPVIVVEVNGTAKAYPLSILMFHEIVNDEIEAEFLSITYCPLCNAAMVFDRRFQVDGKDIVLDFGVSGMLRNSDMVMYDRQTESWWQQFIGQALVGKLAGAQLEVFPSMIISLEKYAESYPSGKVLSTETGHDFNYGNNPYTEYDNLENKQPRLFKGEVDDRLPAMERIINIRANGKHKIYPLAAIQKEKIINDQFQDQAVVFFYDDGMTSVLDKNNIREGKKIGSVTVFNPIVDEQHLTFKLKKGKFIDKQTKSVWNIAGKCIEGSMKGKELEPIIHGNHFAFAWFAFQPECEIYKK